MMLPCRVCGVPTRNKTPKPKRCSDCTKAEALDYSRWYYSVHRDEMREYHRIYHINNRERILVQHAAWRAAKRAAEHNEQRSAELTEYPCGISLKYS
jgi:hypothetical protein